MIIYDLKEKSNAQRSKIIQILYGYNDKSNKGQYLYKRKGLLDDLKYKKDNRTILSFSKESDLKKAVKIFKEMNIEILVVS